MVVDFGRWRAYRWSEERSRLVSRDSVGVGVEPSVEPVDIRTDQWIHGPSTILLYGGGAKIWEKEGWCMALNTKCKVPDVPLTIYVVQASITHKLDYRKGEG